MKLVECVPNFSEGRDRGRIDRIVEAIAAAPGVRLLDVDPGAETNRTVVTFLGEPEAVLEGAFAGIRGAAELIDMRLHRGAHPRQGATDVCPFVPVAGVTMAECVELARRLGERVGRELGIPVYLYEEAATRPERRSLADLRAGEYEALESKLARPEWAPDFGPAALHAKAGATVIGAREFLIAFNVNLNTKNPKKANAVAFDVRTKGRVKRDERGEIVRDGNGEPLREPGALAEVRGIGWYIPEYHRAQISMNLTNFRVTPLHLAMEETREKARERGLVVTGSELVGLVPRQALVDAGRFYLERQGTCPGQSEEELVRVAVQSMGLAELKPFDPAEKVVEYKAGFALAGPLLKLTGREFLNELASDSPAPGGGSVSALAGALAASLATMVGNLTTRNRKMADVHARMTELAVRGQELKDRLGRLVDEDTEAFDRLLAAMRMGKGTPEEAEARDQAVADATRGAALVPLEVMERSLEAMRLAAAAAESGLPASRSDAGVGVLLARAAVEGAHLNVLTNLRGFADREFAESTRARAAGIAREAAELAGRTLAGLHDRIAEPAE